MSIADLGTYKGAGTTGVGGIPKFETWIGRGLTRALDFLYFTKWGDGNVANSPVSLGGWCISSWSKQTPSRQMAFGVPMTIQGTPLSEVAAGAHDDAYLYLAKTLVAKGFPNAVLRIGWEFNGGWFAWAAAGDPTNWVAAFRRIVGIFRSVPGQTFQFDWNPALGQNGIQPDKVYPGDDVVDIVGLDVYNSWWTSADQDPAHRWATTRDQNYGLAWQKKFATAHNKRISFPEWGTGTRPDGHGGADDALFVTNMLQWQAALGDQLAYHNYWDYPASDYNAILSDGSKPLAGAAFLAVLGPTPISKPPPTPAQLDPRQAIVDAATAVVAAMTAANQATVAAATASQASDAAQQTVLNMLATLRTACQ